MSHFDNTAEDVTAHEAEMQDRMEPVEWDKLDMEYRQEMDDNWWEAEAAFYDDDPNPYHGDYSEM